MRRSLRVTGIAALAAFALALAACGEDGVTDDVPDPDEPVTSEPGDDGATDEPDDDPIDDADDLGTDFDDDAAREEARAVLGMSEQDLPEDVRIARRGDEAFMLTEDYVFGRRTVELDDDGGGFRVTSVVVELLDGPETLELEPS